MALDEERTQKLYKDAYKEVKKQTGTLTVEQVTAVNIALDVGLATLDEQLELLQVHNSATSNVPDLIHISDVLDALEAGGNR
jgi:hypothetical protein